MKSAASFTVTSPHGGRAPLDPASVQAFKDDNISQDFLKNNESLWNDIEPLSKYIGKAKEYDAIFYVGGHGPMFDLVTDETSQKLIKEFYESGKVVSAICHGVAALAHVKLSSGATLLAGQAVTSFSNAEEDSIELSQAMPFMLETVLSDFSGAKYSKASEQWGAHVVVSGEGRIITGQNPASAEGLGRAILDAVSVVRASAAHA